MVVTENLVDLFHVVLLDIVGMGIGQPEKTFGEMADDGVLMQKLLVVIPLGEEPFLGAGPLKGALIGENEFLFIDPFPRFLE